jgi:cytochrome c-type biogenesis protein CcmH/NrfF
MKRASTEMHKELNEAAEQLRCAQVNFDNLTELNPAIAAHPMYKVARMQLDMGLATVETIEAES